MKKIIVILFLLSFLNYYKVDMKQLNHITIDKIDLKQEILSYEDSNVDKGIIYLKESNIKNNFYILAAHSGNSKIAYFTNIYKLKKGDELNLVFNNKNIDFIVEEIYYVEKTGKIILPVNLKDTLYLTTCDKFNDKYQLIVKSVKKV